mmetsp:Transcript_22540/g.73247  ORF Transcript_22540/g.73247 Transcript_22540/m.73247 type:complete len:318 (+) Transcript_22540:2368-3321(+)
MLVLLKQTLDERHVLLPQLLFESGFRRLHLVLPLNICHLLLFVIFSHKVLHRVGIERESEGVAARKRRLLRVESLRSLELLIELLLPLAKPGALVHLERGRSGSISRRTRTLAAGARRRRRVIGTHRRRRQLGWCRSRRFLLRICNRVIFVAAARDNRRPLRVLPPRHLRRRCVLHLFVVAVRHNCFAALPSRSTAQPLLHELLFFLLLLLGPLLIIIACDNFLPPRRALAPLRQHRLFVILLTRLLLLPHLLLFSFGSVPLAVTLEAIERGFHRHRRGFGFPPGLRGCPRLRRRRSLLLALCFRGRLLLLLLLLLL